SSSGRRQTRASEQQPRVRRGRFAAPLLLSLGAVVNSRFDGRARGGKYLSSPWSWVLAGRQDSSVVAQADCVSSAGGTLRPWACPGRGGLSRYRWNQMPARVLGRDETTWSARAVPWR